MVTALGRGVKMEGVLSMELRGLADVLRGLKMRLSGRVRKWES